MENSRDEDHVAREHVAVAVVGAGLAGLAIGIALKRLGIGKRIAIFEGREHVASDAGQGMSVIGHALHLMQCLGVEWNEIGVPQQDISLRTAREANTHLYDVPLQVDSALAGQFQNTVQYNVHRGRLFNELHRLYCSTGGVVRTKHRLVDIEERDDGLLLFFDDDRGPIHCSLLIGADGVHSRVRPFVLRGACRSRSAVCDDLNDSGYSCWRGLCNDSEQFRETMGAGAMFKTVVSPPGRSFTCGVVKGGKRFWLLDAAGSKRPREMRENRKTKHDSVVEEVVAAMEGFAEEMKEIVRATAPEDVMVTDVYDGRVMQVRRYARGRAVVIGDAAHPVVHHFGQGACMAFEDAMWLAQCIHEEGIDKLEDSGARALQQYDTWAHWMRCTAILLLSRVCGALYMSEHTWFTHPFLRVCLMWPLSMAFTLIVYVLLFIGGRDLRTFASKTFNKDE